MQKKIRNLQEVTRAYCVSGEMLRNENCMIMKALTGKNASLTDQIWNLLQHSMPILFFFVYY